MAKRAIGVGIEPRHIIAGAMLESGITPAAVGDHGCSKGMFQINECARGKNSAKADQIDVYITSFKDKYDKWHSVERAALYWNNPSAAQKGIYTNYVRKYQNIVKMITI